MAFGMKRKDFMKLAEIVQAALQPTLRDEIRRDIEAGFTAYRRAVSVRDQWCCQEMRTFAAQVWNASAPNLDPQSFGEVSYQLRGHHVNFCPFCGVHLAVKALEHAQEGIARG